MILVVPSLRVRGIALWPFILVKYPQDRHDAWLLNHERIHHRQQLELLVLPFYLWYLTEYLGSRLKGLGHYAAYRNISFEKEAFACEKELNYLQWRPLWAFFGYLGRPF